MLFFASEKRRPPPPQHYSHTAPLPFLITPLPTDGTTFVCFTNTQFIHCSAANIPISPKPDVCTHTNTPIRLLVIASRIPFSQWVYLELNVFPFYLRVVVVIKMRLEKKRCRITWFRISNQARKNSVFCLRDNCNILYSPPTLESILEQK